MPKDTVELPADPAIKQLANDVIQEETEWLVPFILDFHEYFSQIEEDTPKEISELRLDNPKSPLNEQNWSVLLMEFKDQGIIEEEPGRQPAYKLNRPDEE